MSSLKYLHTMIRVSNLEESLDFYVEKLGFKTKSKLDFEEGRFSLVFLYLENNPDIQIELTHNWDIDKYTHGTAYGHMAFSHPDIYALCDELGDRGVIIKRAPGLMKGSDIHLAFIEDPDGYMIELIQS